MKIIYQGIAYKRGDFMAEVTMQSINYLFRKSFFVPTYQRGYRWTETQVKELLEDLYDFVSTKKDENDYYCLQPIIVKKKKTVGNWWMGNND